MVLLLILKPVKQSMKENMFVYLVKMNFNLLIIKVARVGRSGSISIPTFPITQYTNTIDDNFYL